MAIAPLEYPGESTTSLDSLRVELLALGQRLTEHHLSLTRGEILQTLVDVEGLSKAVDHLQILAARAAQDHDVAGTEGRRTAPLLVSVSQGHFPANEGGRQTKPGTGGAGRSENEERARTSRLPEFRSCADFLRATLGISRSEANRRLKLAASLLPGVSLSGAVTPAPMTTVGAAASAGTISSRAVSIVHDAVQRVRPIATPRQLESMEHHLTRQAVESDEDILRVLARRWEGVLNQDGQEPTEKVLRARQGVFLEGRRNGLHCLKIGATDEQFEYLITAMNTATNPRLASDKAVHDGDRIGGNTRADATGGAIGDRDRFAGVDDSGDADMDPDRRTRPQSLLDGLVAACRIALSTGGLPATGGHRPQVMVTIDYRGLMGDLDRAGHAVFGQQISARSIRKLACDADIIPIVLGGQGQVLDVGRAQRLFPALMRRALVARDKGCAFPDCSTPATWCEAHHIVPWSRGGTTNITDGVLLCSRHHHVIHEGDWTVHSKHGTPWFKPPRYRDPHQLPLRNRYWQVEEAVQGQLLGEAMQAELPGGAMQTQSPGGATRTDRRGQRGILQP